MDLAKPSVGDGSGSPQQDLRARFEAQRAAFLSAPPGRARRADALRGLEQALTRQKDRIIEAIAADFGGRAAEETLALDLFPVLNEIRYARRRLKQWMRPRRAPVGSQFWPGRARIMYQPLGVVGILSTWNYPLFLSFAPDRKSTRLNSSHVSISY